MTKKILPLLLILPMAAGCWETPSGWESPSDPATNTQVATPTATPTATQVATPTATQVATPTTTVSTDTPATDTPATDTPATDTPTPTEAPTPTETDIPATPSPESCLDFIDQDGDGFDNCNSADAVDSVEGASEAALSEVVSIGDFNADDWADLAIGSNDLEVNGVHEAGQVSVYFGSQTGYDLSNPPLTFYGSSDEGHSSHPAGAGDINADGYADLLIGASGEIHPDQLGIGRVHLICGRNDLLNEESDDAIALSQEFTDATFYLTEERKQLGYAIAGNGDFNGDGISDMAISAYVGDGSQGIVYVILGKEEYCLDHQDIALPEGADLIIYNSEADESLGAALAFIPDIDGDTYDELVIGAPGKAGALEPGKVFLIFGTDLETGSVFDVELPQGLAMITYGDSVTNTRFGEALSTGGDTDGDGKNDLAIGAPGPLGEEGIGDGDVYVITDIVKPEGEPATAEYSINSALSYSLEGQISGGNFGRSVAIVPDVDKDGKDDILIGAPSPGNIGNAFLFRPFSDTPTVPTVFTGGISGGAFGVHLAALTPSGDPSLAPTLLFIGGFREGSSLGGMVNAYGNLPEEPPSQ